MFWMKGTMLNNRLKSPITENPDISSLSNRELIEYRLWLKKLLKKYRKCGGSLESRKKIQTLIKVLKL